jgi:ubiquitin carboxyl-terminal hydrolase 22/27/51
MLDMAPYTTLFVAPDVFMKHVKKRASRNNSVVNGTSENTTSSKSKSAADTTDSPSKGTSGSPSKSNKSKPTYEKLLETPKDEWPIDMLSYHLSAVIVHKGEINSGHYVNYAREGSDWFLFDDSKVVLVSESEVLKAEAYLLLYVKDNLEMWAEGGSGS